MHCELIVSKRKPYQPWSLVVKSSSVGNGVKSPSLLLACPRGEDSQHLIDIQRTLQELDARPIGQNTSQNLVRIRARINGTRALGTITLA